MANDMLRLLANQVKVGSPMQFSVRDEHGKLLLAKGQVVYNESQMQALLSRGLYADAQEVKAAVGDGAAREASGRKLTLFDLWEQAIWRLDRLIKGMEAEPGFPARCDEFVLQLAALIQRDPDIAIFLSVRQDERRLNLYGLTHALHTALACQLLVARLAWPEARARALVKAALTMNCTIVELQGRFAALGRLTEDQRTQLRAHPKGAEARLRAAGVDDEEWLQAVREHHEQQGGGGYPDELTQVCEGAATLRLADVFMSKISPRIERPALSIQDAARQMFSESQGSPMAAALIKEYGIYPPGNAVQLASGEIAIVIRRGATAHTPMAAAVTDKSGMPVVHTNNRDTSQAAYAIKALISDKALIQRVPPERLYGLAE